MTAETDFSENKTPAVLEAVIKPALAGLLPDEIKRELCAPELKSRLGGKDLPAFRVNQIYKWICGGVSSFDEMKNLPLDLRKILGEKFRVYSSSVTAKLKDRDGTVKLQITLEDGLRVEAVILRDGKDRKTACLSVQAGCPAGCVFCRTAKLGFKRNLSAAEIAEGFLLLCRAAAGGEDAAQDDDAAGGDNPAAGGNETKTEGESGAGISHIVFMGMGEPLLNLPNVRGAVNFFCDENGLNISRRRITLSTCGILSGLRDFTKDGPDIRLAVSLVSGREDLRKRLMPAALNNSLNGLKDCLRDYQKKRRRRITLEAVLLGGVNTGPDDAEAIASFARGLGAVINLIPWNPVEAPSPSADGGTPGPLLFEGQPLKTPSHKEAVDFAAALEQKGLKVTTRFEKGASISGACGQLGS